MRPQPTHLVVIRNAALAEAVPIAHAYASRGWLVHLEYDEGAQAGEALLVDVWDRGGRISASHPTDAPASGVCRASIHDASCVKLVDAADSRWKHWSAPESDDVLSMRALKPVIID